MSSAADSAPVERKEPGHRRLASFLRRLLRPRKPANDQVVAGKGAVTWRKLQINLSGTRVGVTEATTGKNPQTRAPGQDLKIERCEIIGQPISYQDADFKLDVVAKNLSVARVPRDGPRRRPVVDFDDGHVTLRMTPDDIQTLLKTVADQLLRDYHVTIDEAAVRFQTPSRRQLQVDLRVTAKRRWLWACVQLTGGLVIDDDLHARLSGLKANGRGGLGRLIAAWAKPHLQRLQEKEFSLVSQSFAGVRPRDIEFTAGETLQIKIEFESGSLLDTTTKQQASLPVMGENLAATLNRKSTKPRQVGRLDIYVIDTGWNEHAKQVLHDHLKLFESFLAGHMIYVLSQDQSKEILEKTPPLIGEDPILVMVDSDARIERPRHGYGVRLCLGAMPRERLSDNLKMVLQIASDRTRTTGQIIRQLRKECHKQGLDGAIEIVGDMIRPE